MAWFSSILILALGSALCSGAILENVADLNKLNLKFDFIVVGGESFALLLLLVHMLSSVKAERQEMSLPIAFRRIPTIRFWCLKQAARKTFVSI